MYVDVSDGELPSPRPPRKRAKTTRATGVQSSTSRPHPSAAQGSSKASHPQRQAGRGAATVSHPQRLAAQGSSTSLHAPRPGLQGGSTPSRTRRPVAQWSSPGGSGAHPGAQAPGLVPANARATMSGPQTPVRINKGKKRARPEDHSSNGTPAHGRPVTTPSRSQGFLVPMVE